MKKHLYSTRFSCLNHTAFTLVELLVAITIAAVLTVIALPRVREGLQQNVASRTATLVKGTFENARAQAIRTGRPYGVRLHRVANTVSTGNQVNDPLLDATQGANYCKQLSYVQMAFEYRGDDENANIKYFPPTGGSTQTVDLRADSATSGLLYAIANGTVPVDQQAFSIGSTIRIGLDATPYVIESIAPNTTSLSDDPSSPVAGTSVVARLYYPMRPGSRNPPARQPLPYSIETRPVASPLAPVDLPGKVVLDLASSGTSQYATLFSPASIQGTATLPPVVRPAVTPAIPDYGFHDVIVMFSPTGLLDSIYVDVLVNPATNAYAYGRVEPLGALSFLIGEVDGVVRPQTIGMYPFQRTGLNGTAPAIAPAFTHLGRKRPNFANANSAWITVNPVSGKTILHAVAPPLDPLDIVPVLAPVDQSLERLAHPEYATNHAPEIIIRNRLLDSRRFVRGQSQ